MKEGGSELGCCGIELMWLISCEVKVMEAVSGSVQPMCAEVGESGGLPVGEGARERSFGKG